MDAITNLPARDDIRARIMAAPNGKRRGVGAAFRTDASKARYLARGEQALGIVGSFRFSAVLSPVNARGASPFKGASIMYYGANAVLEHEEAATGEALDWFNNAFARAA